MAERDPDYPKTHLIENVHLASDSDSTVTVPTVTVTQNEHTTTAQMLLKYRHDVLPVAPGSKSTRTSYSKLN